ncbi:thiamine phosphate synthase [Legionella sp. W05-934-2]|uniref:thiamine phosphate synthase n=1 Tax=Legionella sp. W05-934-2 TaxID=1198649 RepID=UPI0034620452
MIDSLALCLVTNYQHDSLPAYLDFLGQVIEGGVTAVQYRDKTNPLPVIRKTAIAIKQFLSPYSVPLIINDYVALAAEIDADGVHIGQSDCSPARARALLGSDKLIGYSIESLAQLNVANQLEALDYVAASAVFPSQTKTDCQTIWGLAGLKEVVQKSHHPVVAIGGITHDNACEVIKQGAAGIAVVSALHDHPSPSRAASQLIQQIRKGKDHV